MNENESTEAAPPTGNETARDDWVRNVSVDPERMADGAICWGVRVGAASFYLCDGVEALIASLLSIRPGENPEVTFSRLVGERLTGAVVRPGDVITAVVQGILDAGPEEGAWAVYPCETHTDSFTDSFRIMLWADSFRLVPWSPGGPPGEA